MTELRRGWTTGACATAAASACATALTTGHFPDPVDIPLPRGGHTAFALAESHLTDDIATAAVVKDAGDDPDVTHGALIRVQLTRAPTNTGVTFKAGQGVGTVTRPGLPIPPGEPAINPTPRAMITRALHDCGLIDILVEISIPDGEALARQTLNGRLGIVGGLSILGTTGIVVPFSCAAWIDTIHRGIDVARATGLDHVAASTGSTSELAVQQLHALPDHALIEMGDFAGATLKYLRRHPVSRVTLAGGLAKMTKLAQGRLDLHSKRGALDLAALSRMAGLDALATANNGAEAFDRAEAHGVDLAAQVAVAAWRTAAPLLAGSGSALQTVLVDRTGRVRAQTGFIPT